MNRLLRKSLTFATASVLTIAAVGGCANTPKGAVPASEFNAPVARVEQSIDAIGTKATNIATLSDRIVGEPNVLVQGLIKADAVAIHADTVNARQSLTNITAVGEEATAKLQEANKRIEDHQREAKKRAEYIDKLEKQFFSPFQIKWFWRILIAYVAFQVIFGLILGANPGFRAQSWGKTLIRFLPFMNLASRIRDARLPKA